MPKGLDFLLSDILAPAYEILRIDQEVGSCVWPEIGNHRRKQDKIQERGVGFHSFPLISRLIYVIFAVFAIAWTSVKVNHQPDLFLKLLSHNPVSSFGAYLWCKVCMATWSRWSTYFLLKLCKRCNILWHCASRSYLLITFCVWDERKSCFEGLNYGCRGNSVWF